MKKLTLIIISISFLLFGMLLPAVSLTNAEDTETLPGWGFSPISNKTDQEVSGVTTTTAAPNVQEINLSEDIDLNELVYCNGYILQGNNGCLYDDRTKGDTLYIKQEKSDGTFDEVFSFTNPGDETELPFGYYEIRTSSLPEKMIKGFTVDADYLTETLYDSPTVSDNKATVNLTIDLPDKIGSSPISNLSGTIKITKDDMARTQVVSDTISNAGDRNKSYQLPQGGYYISINTSPILYTPGSGNPVEMIVKSFSGNFSIGINDINGSKSIKYQLEEGAGVVQSQNEAKVIVQAKVGSQNISKGIDLRIFDITNLTTNLAGDLVYPVAGTDASGTILPFSNSDDRTYLVQNGFNPSKSIDDGGVYSDSRLKLYQGRKYRFIISDTTNAMGSVGKDVTLGATNYIPLEFNKIINPVTTGGATSAKPAGTSASDIASYNQVFVTMEKPNDNAHINRDGTVTAEATLDNFPKMAGNNDGVHIQWHIDNDINLTGCEQGTVSGSMSGSVAPSGGAGTMFKKIDNSPHTETCTFDPGDYVDAGDHTLSIHVWRWADANPRPDYFDTVDFSYGAQVYIYTPKANDNFPKDKHDGPVKFTGNVTGLDGIDKHVIMYFDDYAACDFSSIIEYGDGFDPMTGEPMQVIKKPAQQSSFVDIQKISNTDTNFSCDIMLNGLDGKNDKGMHSLIMKVYPFNDDIFYKNDIKICLTDPDGSGKEECGTPTAGGTTVTHASVQAGELGAIQLTKPGRLSEASDLAEVVANIIRFLFGAVGLALVIAYVFAAFKYLTGAGNEDSVTAAKKWFVFATVGLIVVLLAAATVEFVGQRIAGRSILSTGGLKVPVLKLPKITEATTDSTAGLRVYVATLISDGIILLGGMAGLVSLFFVMLGGYYYIFSGGDQAQAEKGKKALTGAIVGFLIVVFAVTIVSLAQYVTRVDWQSDANWKNAPPTTVQNL